jgi:hypothetical protein
MRRAVVKLVGFRRKRREGSKQRDLKARDDSEGRTYFIRQPEGGEAREYFDNLAAAVKGREYPVVPVSGFWADEADLVLSHEVISNMCLPNNGGAWGQNLPNSLDDRIAGAFSKADDSGISAFVVYDPSEEGPYHFISIAERSNTAKDAIQSVPEFEKGSGEKLALYWHPNRWHPARKLGKRYMVKADFRQRASKSPRQAFPQDKAEKPRQLLYVPVEGIVTCNGAIPDNVLKRCVDSAKFEL